MEKKFESPQEEALEIAIETRKKILDGEEDIISVLRRCLVVANNISKEKDIEWIKGEILGKFGEIPKYRTLYCPRKKKNIPQGLKLFEIRCSIKMIQSYLNNKEDIPMVVEGDDKEIATIRPQDGGKIIESVTNKCLFFLNDTITELQWGSYLQSFFERIRRQVESRMMDVSKDAHLEIQSMYTNLISENPSDWPKVALGCRRILKKLADKVFPASNVKYKTKNGHDWEVKDGNWRNRLICFLDKKSSSKLVISECEVIKKYFKITTGDMQDGVHEDLSKHDASMIALHTYLIISEILDKIPKKSGEVIDEPKEALKEKETKEESETPVKPKKGISAFPKDSSGPTTLLKKE